jgi:hypothetical protein
MVNNYTLRTWKWPFTDQEIVIFHSYVNVYPILGNFQMAFKQQASTIGVYSNQWIQ